eukprot:TRINITY_DN3307_c0_g1_i2.p1 TRINITY_DN3307_c0_g1~~TRINITY_DN3307_c0_g1_i2.p1  ORF type:complete len:574 (+),score=118.49 TRINITY_DN3307_c0_g1_i2:64-1785(+)
MCIRDRAESGRPRSRFPSLWAFFKDFCSNKPQEVNIDELIEANNAEVRKALQDLSNSLMLYSIVALSFFIWLQWRTTFLIVVLVFYAENIYRIIFNISESRYAIRTIERVNCFLAIIESILLAVFKGLFVLSVEMKLLRISFTTGPLFLYAVLRFCFYFSNKAKTDCASLQDFVLILTRAFFVAQTQLIFLRVDGFVTWDWSEVFWLYWVWFSMLVGIEFGIFLMLLSRIVSKVMGQPHDADVKGLLLLNSLCLEFLIVSCVTLISFLRNNSNGTTIYDSLTIRSLTIFACILHLGLTFYIRRYRPDLEKFFSRLSSVTEVPVDQTEELESRRRRRRSLRTRIFPKFLTKITSTYFKETPQEELKKKAKQKKGKAKKNAKGPETTTTEGRERTIEPTYSAMTEKNMTTTTQNLVTEYGRAARRTTTTAGRTDGQLIIEIPTFNAPTRPGAVISQEEVEVREYHSELDQRIDPINVQSPSSARGAPPQAVSVAPEPLKPLEIVRQSSSKGKVDQSNANCLICYEKQADAVIMNCGHGGLCHGCAVESWSKNECCYLCRESLYAESGESLANLAH